MCLSAAVRGRDGRHLFILKCYFSCSFHRIVGCFKWNSLIHCTRWSSVDRRRWCSCLEWHPDFGVGVIFVLSQVQLQLRLINLLPEKKEYKMYKAVINAVLLYLTFKNWEELVCFSPTTSENRIDELKKNNTKIILPKQRMPCSLCQIFENFITKRVFTVSQSFLLFIKMC